MQRSRRRWPVLAILTAAALLVCGLLAGCDAGPRRAPRNSEVWSKGLPLGMASLNNRVALDVDDQDGVYAVWVDLERALYLVRLDDRAAIVVDRALDLAVDRPQRPQLALDAGGQLHLTWLDRAEVGLGLWYARLSPEGEVLQGATLLSAPDQSVGHSVLLVEPVGRTVEVFWSDSAPAKPGIYHAALDGSGNVVVLAETLVDDGLWPAAQVDDQGLVHLAWQVREEDERPDFYYALYDARSRMLGEPVVVTAPLTRASVLGAPTAGGQFIGPWLGLDREGAYLAFALEIRVRADLSSFVFYQPLALLGPPGGGDESPQAMAEPVRVWVGDPRLTGDPSLLPGQPPEQVMACYTQAVGPGDLQTLQSAVVPVQAAGTGEPQIVSGTSGASLQPAIRQDAQGFLHLLWIDTAGFNQYRVIYASTAPQVGEVLNPVTAGEVVDQVLGFGFGLLSLVLVVPFVLLWALPSFLLLALLVMFSPESSLAERRTRGMLGVAVVLQMALQVGILAGSTQGLLGGLLPALSGVMGWLSPLLISVISVALMVLYIRRREEPSVLASFAVFAGANALLFVLVYLLPMALERF
jgi:hypothetical protein